MNQAIDRKEKYGAHSGNPLRASVGLEALYNPVDEGLAVAACSSASRSTGLYSRFGKCPPRWMTSGWPVKPLA